MKNMCYTRILCCSTADTTELNQCIDSTTFTCNLTAVCASHAEDESWYPYTINNGLSVSCCQDGYTTTPAPAVPDFGFSDESDEDYVLRQGPLPQRTCDDSTSEGCVATNHFPSLVRAFCQDAIPPSYTNDYILQSAPHICCKYATAPASTKAYDSAVGTVKCGMDLLDLPRIGEFHCSMVGRAETICCNGVISSTVAEDSTATDSALGDNYTYTGNTCLFVPDIGDSAKYSDLSSVALVTVAAVTVMIDSF
ncbi:hypothetical protein ABL78_2505 [Leptomonas seymouri]|uniref:Uncharacterized protein n=1 Tax=Leptomonas seymouri TaxID=5684 RepID=A0A0N0P748_LEPSE|nr:hypothetical protein ABL78_2505 [Leptomonas seymouri]|eukprot:KPI88386.1 hypothetical protein ABL78_2505 [Leptomonas seymouri]